MFDSMDDLLERYGSLLHEVDEWFLACSARYPDQIMCHNGCSSCCRGLFDITLLDAIYLKRGVDGLSEHQRSKVMRSAHDRLNSLSASHPAFVEPWLLNAIPEEEWELLMPEDDEIPCLLLSESGECLVYGNRPMTCRLNGIPLIDLSGEELFDEWCTLNFTGNDPRKYIDLRFGFTELFAQELLLFHELTNKLTGTPVSEIDLFIPAAIVLNLEKTLPAIKTMK